MSNRYANIPTALLEPFKQGFGDGLRMLRAPHRSLDALATSLRRLLNTVISARWPKSGH